MRILAIETSCDETAISVVEATGGLKNPKFKILGNTVASQVELHAEYGGVFPAMAKREHIKNLPIVLAKTLKKAGIRTPSGSPLSTGRKNAKKIDLISVTSGPGLEPALWTGIVFAKELAEKWNVPLVPVNHMEGHIFSVFGKGKGTFTIPKIKFPALSLLVSGGHTELVLVKDWMKYKMLGSTRDDAAGEAFDKVARMLDLKYPGGPEISRLAALSRSERGSMPDRRSAQAGEPSKANFQQKIMRAERGHLPSELVTLPRPMIYTKDYDFSFSGLKTAVLYFIRDNGKPNEKMKMEIAREFEDAVVEVLVAKTLRAAAQYKVQNIIVGGGVSANKRLKEILEQKAKESKIPIYFPARELSTDNSLMIAIAGYLRSFGKIKNPKLIKARGNLGL